MQGKIRITQLKNGKEIDQSDWYDNLIVDSGLELITKAIADGTPIKVDSAEIGNSGTAVSASDTNLNSPILTGIIVESAVISGKQVTFSFFLTDNELADGVYREFGLRVGSTLFSHVLFKNPYTKATGVDTRIDYVVTSSAVV